VTEGLAAVDLENPLAGPVRGNLVERRKLVRTRDGSPTGLRMAQNPSDLARGRSILGVGEVPRFYSDAARDIKTIGMGNHQYWLMR
jgi:hypothetical protein